MLSFCPTYELLIPLKRGGINVKTHEKNFPAYGLRIMLMALLVAIALLTQSVFAGVIIPPGTIDPRTIPQFVNQLDGPPPVWVPTYTTGGIDSYEITVSEFEQQILPSGFPTTTVWGYGGIARDAVTGDSLGFFKNIPAGTFEAERGTPIKVKWTNDLTGEHLYPVDTTLHWANPSDSSVPIVPHLHGGEIQSTSDGHPDAWFTATGEQGSAYNTYEPTGGDSAVFYYPNAQPPATLWYHDHALGITRINVLSGLAGFYLLRDTGNETNLIAGPQYEIPLAIQDRTFWATAGTNYKAGDFWFDQVGINPTIHPYWTPEHFGNTIMVNGKVWPNMNVNQTRYRFRLLDGSNARFYDIQFWDSATDNRIPFFQIGTDGGYLAAPIPLKHLVIAPGERADIVVDFTGVVGPVIMRNDATRYPYPRGTPSDPATDGTIMQFTVNQTFVVTPPPLPTSLNTITPLPAPATSRTRVLWEVMGALGPLEVLLNGQKWAGDLSENPSASTTEDWIIVNPTADTHPIHLHLVQFQLISRQSIDIKKYMADWLALQQQELGDPLAEPPWPLNYTPVELDITPYLKGKPKGPAANEKGWKDTIQMNPGEVTIIRARWSPIGGDTAYPFNPATGPGYVWHCHILDHEDNEMMRPYTVTSS